MLYLKYILSVLADILGVASNIIAAPILSIFTKAQPDLDEHGEPWGWIYGTWDNPPQGDEKWQREGWFPNITTGWKGYLNRIGWLYRNPCYGLQRMLGVKYNEENILSFTGNPDISDKYKVAGSYFAKLHSPKGDLLAFEYYLLKPWSIGSYEKCIRIRLGWKMMTDKFQRYGFATMVDTVNPHKGYGKDA